MLLAHLMRAAACRTFWTAGTSRPMRMAMMAITTSSSISVKAPRPGNLIRMADLSFRESKDERTITRITPETELPRRDLLQGDVEGLLARVDDVGQAGDFE